MGWTVTYEGFKAENHPLHEVLTYPFETNDQKEFKL